MAQADKFTSNSVKNQYYSDFLVDLNRHPVSGDIVRFVNEQAVIRSIKNLILTDRGERPYQPLLGSNVRKMLFELSGTGSGDEIIGLIKETIERHEPRAKILDIQGNDDPDNNAISVSITIMILNKQDPINFSVNIQRVR